MREGAPPNTIRQKPKAFKAEEWLREFVRPKCLEQGSNSEEFFRAISTVLLILSVYEWNGMYSYSHSAVKRFSL